MKGILKFKKITILALAFMLMFFSSVNIVKAVTDQVIDNNKKASLTITKYEHANGSEENISLAGVEFTIYSIPSNIETVSDAQDYIKNNAVNSHTDITPENGTITFTNLELGRYLVEETDAPKNVMTKVESFLIDLPRSNDNGSTWEYDVTVYPKNITVYGGMIWV